MSIACLVGIEDWWVQTQLYLKSLMVHNWNNWIFSPNHIFLCYVLKGGKKYFFILCHSWAGFLLCKKQLYFREQQLNVWNGKMILLSLESGVCRWHLCVMYKSVRSDLRSATESMFGLFSCLGGAAMSSSVPRRHTGQMSTPLSTLRAHSVPPNTHSPAASRVS
jgi:hypothetical protein